MVGHDGPIIEAVDQLPEVVAYLAEMINQDLQESIRKAVNADRRGWPQLASARSSRSSFPP